MPDAPSTREEDLRRLLTDAIEVQLAALRAGIGFWSEWIEKTSAFVQSATKTLSEINSEENPKDVLLELVDAGRTSVRAMTEIPRHTAQRFLEELDRAEKKAPKGGGAKPAPAVRTPGAPGSPGAPAGGPRPRRAGRVKA